MRRARYHLPTTFIIEASIVERAFAESADCTGVDACNEDAVAALELFDLATDFLHDANPLMSESTPFVYGRNVAFDDMQIGSADGRSDHLNERLRLLGDLGHIFVHDFDLAYAIIRERFHCAGFPLLLVMVKCVSIHDDGSVRVIQLLTKY